MSVEGSEVRGVTTPALGAASPVVAQAPLPMPLRELAWPGLLLSAHLFQGAEVLSLRLGILLAVVEHLHELVPGPDLLLGGAWVGHALGLRCNQDERWRALATY